MKQMFKRNHDYWLEKAWKIFRKKSIVIELRILEKCFYFSIVLKVIALYN